MIEEIVATLAGIGLLALACQWIAWWVKLPAILFLLLSGIVVGPATGWLDPGPLFGDLLFPMVSLSVALILFEGSLTLRFHEIKGLHQVVRNFVTIGLLVTWITITLATHAALGFPWQLCFLFGAVTVVTGPTVIVPMLRTVRPNVRIANILKWEGIVIDPIGALLAVLVFEFIISRSGGGAMEHALFTFGRIVVTGLLTGVSAGYFWGTVLKKHWLPEYLHNVGTLTMVFGVFAFSNAIQEESGLLTVTAMGLWLANMKGVPVDEIIDFKESLSLLLISILFIVLAARIEFSQFQELGWAALWVFLAIQFVARPLKVFVSTWGSTLNWRERVLLGWIAPRGIVAAAISVLFAIRLEQQGFPQAGLLVPLAFLVIIGTVVLQSATAGFLARRLGVADPEPNGFLIVGANPVARTIAKALMDNGFDVLLTSSTWGNVSKARMDGIKTYFGNPVSEHADRHIDLVGLGRMLGMTPLAEINTLACLHFRGEFGRNKIFSLQTSLEKKLSEKHRPAAHQKGYILFGEDVTYQKLASLISQGAKVRSTQLTANFLFDAFKEKYKDKAIPLFSIDTKGKIQVFVVDGVMKPVAGWTILSLVTEGAKEKTQKTA